MAFAILRINKLKTAADAAEATAHNYRQYRVANADEQAPHPSVEFVNTSERGYWELATERIQQAGIVNPRRADAIRCAEVLLTASPEWFTRDEQGRATDYSKSKWTQDNLDYLKQTFGAANLIAFKLHQDEKSPHIHAVITPITADGRLSGRDLLGPGQLRKYQTSYAQAMAEHGLERGTENSQVEHQPMKRFYGQQAQTARQVGELTGPFTYLPVHVDNPGRMQLNPEKWAAEQSKIVNEQARRQVEEANKRAEIARSLALENAAAKDQVRALQKRLDASEKQGQDKTAQVGQLTSELAQVQNELAQATKKLAQVFLDRERYAIASYEGRLVPELVAEGKNMEFTREAERRYVLQPKVEVALAGRKFDTPEEYFKQIEGYSYQEGKQGQPGRLQQLVHPNMSFTLAEARPAGAPPLLQAVQEIVDSRERARQLVQAQIGQEALARAEQARQAVIAQELDLMQRLFKQYGWKRTFEDLTACLVVPDKHVERLQEVLCTPGSYGRALAFRDAPMRPDGRTAVYAQYQPYKAKKITDLMERMKELGGEVFEPAADRTRREQALTQAQPQPNRRQERQPIRSQDYGIGD